MPEVGDECHHWWLLFLLPDSLGRLSRGKCWQSSINFQHESSPKLVLHGCISASIRAWISVTKINSLVNRGECVPATPNSLLWAQLLLLWDHRYSQVGQAEHRRAHNKYFHYSVMEKVLLCFYQDVSGCWGGALLLVLREVLVHCREQGWTPPWPGVKSKIAFENPYLVQSTLDMSLHKGSWKQSCSFQCSHSPQELISFHPGPKAFPISPPTRVRSLLTQSLLSFLHAQYPKNPALFGWVMVALGKCFDSEVIKARENVFSSKSIDALASSTS